VALRLGSMHPTDNRLTHFRTVQAEQWHLTKRQRAKLLITRQALFAGNSHHNTYSLQLSPPQKYPAGQAPLHADVVIADVVPYVPRAQSLHVLAPSKEYFPAGHTNAAAMIEP
jgi:hypothetical protein